MIVCTLFTNLFQLLCSTFSHALYRQKDAHTVLYRQNRALKSPAPFPILLMIEVMALCTSGLEYEITNQISTRQLSLWKNSQIWYNALRFAKHNSLLFCAPTFKLFSSFFDSNTELIMPSTSA